jgi:hypothetical protein
LKEGFPIIKIGIAMNQLILIFTTVFLSSCRSRSGGPAQRLGYEMDQAAYKVGGGIKRVGQSIQSAATR